VIRELSIGDGTGTPQKIYLKVDTDKFCHVILPNGDVLESTAGVIDSDWQGVEGSIVLIVQKNTELFNIDELGVGTFALIANSLTINLTAEIIVRGSQGIDNLRALHATKINASNCLLRSVSATNVNYLELFNSPQLNDFYSPYATYVNGSNSAITAKSIGDFLIAASVNNPTANGEADFSGVTNALFANIALYMHSIGVIGIPNPPALSAWLTANLSTWSLTFRLV